jgi:hypothetical protein
MKLRLAVLLLVTALVSPAAATPQEDAAKEIQKGITAFNAQHFDEAYRSFQGAWDLDRQPVILLYLARTSANRPQATVSDALDHLNRWLVVAGAGQASPDWVYLPKAFAAVKQLAADQEQTIAQLSKTTHILTEKVEKAERSVDLAQRELKDRDARLRDWERRYDQLDKSHDGLDRPGRDERHAEPPDHGGEH